MAPRHRRARTRRSELAEMGPMAVKYDGSTLSVLHVSCRAWPSSGSNQRQWPLPATEATSRYVRSSPPSLPISHTRILRTEALRHPRPPTSCGLVTFVIATPGLPNQDNRERQTAGGANAALPSTHTMAHLPICRLYDYFHGRSAHSGSLSRTLCLCRLRLLASPGRCTNPSNAGSLFYSHSKQKLAGLAQPLRKSRKKKHTLPLNSLDTDAVHA